MHGSRHERMSLRTPECVYSAGGYGVRNVVRALAAAHDQVPLVGDLFAPQCGIIQLVDRRFIAVK
jgi:hypothetical protein